MSNNIDLSFFDNAPEAIAVFRAKYNELTGFECVYTNQKFEELNFVKTEPFEEELSKLVNAKKLKTYTKDATTHPVEFPIDDSFSVSCWWPNSEYCGLIIKQTKNEKKKIESILNKTIDFTIDFDLNTINISCLEEYGFIPVAKCLGEEATLSSHYTLDRCQVYKFISMLKKLKNGKKSVRDNLKIKTPNSEEYMWYDVHLCREGTNVIGVARNINENMMKLEKYQLKAERDALTGVFNHKKAVELIKPIISDEQSALFVMDIDDFKGINDTYGHPCGDSVIKKTADIIQTSFRETDIIYRIGGDEFAVFTPGLNDPNFIATRCGELFRQMEKASKNIPFSISIGIAIKTDLGQKTKYKKYYKKADQALYKAKSRGKGKWLVKNVD